MPQTCQAGQETRIAWITLWRFVMLTREAANGKPLPWDRLPASQWPLLATGTTINCLTGAKRLL